MTDQGDDVENELSVINNYSNFWDPRFAWTTRKISEERIPLNLHCWWGASLQRYLTYFCKNNRNKSCVPSGSEFYIIVCINLHIFTSHFDLFFRNDHYILHKVATDSCNPRYQMGAMESYESCFLRSTSKASFLLAQQRNATKPPAPIPNEGGPSFGSTFRVQNFHQMQVKHPCFGHDFQPCIIFYRRWYQQNC